MAISWASNASAQQLWIGPRVGFNSSMLSSAPPGTGNLGFPDDITAQKGLVAGAAITYRPQGRIGLSVATLYTQRNNHVGYAMNGIAKFTHYEYDQQINYLNVPVEFSYAVYRHKRFQPMLFAGSLLGVRLNAKSSNYKIDGQQAADTKGDISKRINPLFVGITAGIQFLTQGLSERQQFVIEGRCTYGITPVSTNYKNPQNAMYSLTVGYNVDFSRR